MSKKLYLECNTGISGDMSVASLIGLGVDQEKLIAALSSIKKITQGFDIKITEVEKSGIRAWDFDVILDEDNFDHNMDYLYGHENGEAEMVDAGHHEHHNDHHHDHHHVHRTLKDVTDIINVADITNGAKEIAIKTFTIVANAEAAVHGRDLDNVHFHEVGAVDSIVDIVAAAVCFDEVVTSNDIDEVIVTKLVDGTGTVRCQHGVIPVPVPAVVKIAEQTGVPLAVSNRQGEFVTPTGAAFAAAIMTSDTLPEVFRIVKTGLGAGKREHVIPGIVRAMIIE